MFEPKMECAGCQFGVYTKFRFIMVMNLSFLCFVALSTTLGFLTPLFWVDCLGMFACKCLN